DAIRHSPRLMDSKLTMPESYEIAQQEHASGRAPRFACARCIRKFSAVDRHKFQLGRNLAAVPGFVGGPTQAGDQYGHDGSISQICRRMRSNGQDQSQSRKQDILEWLSPEMAALCATDGETR